MCHEDGGLHADANPGDEVCATRTGVCTLRAAIHEANALAGADTIHVPGGTYQISRPAAEPNNIRTGDLDITGELTVSGAGSGRSIIAGAGRDRVIEVSGPSGEVNINDVTVRTGSHPQTGGGVTNSGGGTVTLARSLILSNSASKLGGGVANERGGTVRLVGGTRLSGNSADDAGGAVANLAEGTVEITDGRVSSNSSTLGGAAISNTGISPSEGTITLLRATVANNVAGSGTSPGGGISNLGDGAVTVDRSKVSGNRSASSGGGIAGGGGTVDVADSTIVANKAEGGSGGGVSNAGEGFLTVAASTLSSNVASGEGGAVQSADKGGLLLTNSSLSGNSAVDGGAIHTSGDQGATVVDSVISGNGATQHGGGLNSSGTSEGALAIERVSFSRNEASGDGGGLMLEGGPTTIRTATSAPTRESRVVGLRTTRAVW